MDCQRPKHVLASHIVQAPLAISVKREPTSPGSGEGSSRAGSRVRGLNDRGEAEQEAALPEALIPLLTVSQVAQYFQVDRAAIYRWTAERDLPAIRLSPKKLRFDVRDIRDWLGARKS
jgi:excisionase family DNA binding protein